MLSQITPDNATFVLLSFEGPDVYSQAGGLGVRMAELSRTLAQLRFMTHLFFVGDPGKPGHEMLEDGFLWYHRWCQWISAYYPNGVYQGEADKLREYEKSLPPTIVDEVVRPNAQQGKLTVILAEEWHTAGTVMYLDWLLRLNGLRDRAIIFWNANNTYGFNLIDFQGLQATSVITTVSRYMKHRMWQWGVDPMVIPNGIPERMLRPVDQERVHQLRTALEGNTVLAKVGRYDPDKRWLMAMDAVASLKVIGMNPKFLVRGGMEPHRMEVYQRARANGLTWHEVRVADREIGTILHAIWEHRHADVLELNFFVPEEFLRILYAAADGVLANSSHEPFGLVGLEVMACGGVAYTGCSGEDYAQSFQNAVVIDTDDAREIATYVFDLEHHPDRKARLRENALLTARNFLWQDAVRTILRKLTYIGFVGGARWNG